MHDICIAAVDKDYVLRVVDRGNLLTFIGLSDDAFPNYF